MARIDLTTDAEEPDAKSCRELVLEGVVVLVLLLTTAANIIPRIIGQSRERPAPAKSDLSTISSALHNFRLDCKRYPTNVEGLNSLTIMPSYLKSCWEGPYLTKPAGPDPWGHPYVYFRTKRDSYTLLTYGADGKPGGDGDDADIVEGCN